MTRIVAGSVGGRRIATPAGSVTRPTSDRVREAVFSALEVALGSWAGRAFLDLYAGSGAMGLEALSRGAARATLVEQHRRTAQVARDNAQLLGLRGAEVVRAPVQRFLRSRRGGAQRYSAVFVDPPYSLRQEPLAEVLTDLVGHDWLAGEAVVVVERSSRSPAPRWPEPLVPMRARRYGETTVWYGRAT